LAKTTPSSYPRGKRAGPLYSFGLLVLPQRVSQSNQVP